MKKYLIAAVLAAVSLAMFAGCQNSIEKEDDFMQERALYVQQYSDYETRDNWVKKNIDETDIPPVSFEIDGVHSETLKWKKKTGEAKLYVDFADEAPSNRVCREIIYECAEKGIKIVLTETSYPGYAVCEYDAVLENISGKKSGLISNMLTVNTSVESNGEGAYTLHTNRGSLCTFNDFEALSYKLKDTVSLSVSNGKTTSEYIPYFNLENMVNNTGTIAILNWQGNWKADFTKNDDGVSLCAGQYLTNFELKKGETMRYPGLVLMFYKGDCMKGQNVYRRWIYECNLFRYQEKHMKETNVLICPDPNTAKGDLAQFEFYKENGLLEYIDKFNKDAGWYETEGRDWTYTGNWFVSDKAYPNGFKELADAAHSEGLEFAVWFEPERIQQGTQTASDLRGKLMTGSSVEDADVGKGATLLLNYADDSVVEYVVEMLDRIITENGIDQYRQDFNMFPGQYWTAWDAKESEELDMERTGVTENHYATGYLKVFSELVKRHPGMYIDACASGGMRYDLETMRYSFMHTRSDYWASIESAQCQTYGSSMWFLYWGTGFTDLSSYDVRSHIGNSIGVGASTKKQAEQLKNALIEWKYIAGYLSGDYYPLTKNAGSGNNTMALQYDSPEKGNGMFITYFRKDNTALICPTALDPDAKYSIWDYDNKESTVKTLTGKEIMEGIEISSGARTAVIYEYELLPGENTEAFRKAEVATGKGSTDYVEPQDSEEPIEELPKKSEAVYKNGPSDEELCALNGITEDGKIVFASVDYRSTGVIYSISKNIYDELYKSGKTIGGWTEVMKSHLYIKIDSTNEGPFVFTTWDSGYFPQQPLTREIDGKYFLWLANMIPFSDSDGGWTDWDVSLSWDKKSGGKGSAKIEGFTVDHSKNEKISCDGTDSLDAESKIYSITEEIFNSIVYSGKCFVTGGEKWYEADPSKIGICSLGVKAPSEGTDVAGITTFFDTLKSEEISLLAAKTEEGYKIMIKNGTHFPLKSSLNRVLLVWYNENGELMQQGFLM